MLSQAALLAFTLMRILSNPVCAKENNILREKKLRLGEIDFADLFPRQSINSFPSIETFTSMFQASTSESTCSKISLSLTIL